MPALPAEVVAVLPRLRPLQGIATASIAATRLAGWSNAVWRLDTPAGSFALRLPGSPATNAVPRADEVHNAALAASIGVAVPALEHDPSDGLLLTPWIATRHGFDAREPGAPARVGALLSRLHRSGLAFRWRFDGEAVAARQIVHLSADDPARELLDAHWAEATALLRRLDATRGPPVACHNDPNPANLLDDGVALRLIDWEYSGLNDPFFDLAAFAEEVALDAAGCRALLSAWGDCGPAAVERLAMQRRACRWIAGLWFLGQAAARTDPALRAEAVRRLEAW